VKRPIRASSLLIRLLVSYLLPTLALFALFGWLAHREAARRLEESLGRRLIGIAQASAAHLRPASVRFLSRGDDQSRTARRLRTRLRALRQRTRVARIFVLDRELRSRIDTREGVRIGDRDYQAEADREELRRLFRWGEEASSVLFAGADGRFYKTGYAPLRDGARTVAAVGVEGSAEYFAVLARLRRVLLLSGGVVALLVMLASVLVARRITRPLRSLAGEAARIGAGDLERPIAVEGRDEVGLLARTMNEMRQGLHERDTQMQMMLSGIAHEVRNPLGGIELFAGLLREELEGDAEKLEHVGRIDRELTHLKKVVGDFLDYARRARPTMARVDLGALIGELCQLLAADADERGVELRSDARQTWASCDIDQIRRVLINLTRNAIQATPGGGGVRLGCDLSPDDDDRVVCEVSDSGSGIAPEVLDEIFKPFFTTRQKGTGLGLALSKKIVDEHGGELSVESEPGQGATFRVTLPAAPRDRNDNGNDPDH
jgi:signal transduction histidine kinase